MACVGHILRISKYVKLIYLCLTGVPGSEIEYLELNH